MKKILFLFVVLLCCSSAYSQDAEQHKYWITDIQLQHLKQIYVNLNQNNLTLQEQLQSSMQKSENLESTSWMLQEQLKQSLIRQENSEQKSETLKEQLTEQALTLESLNSSYEILNSRYYEILNNNSELNRQTIELGTRLKAWRTAAIIAMAVALAELVILIIKLR